MEEHPIMGGTEVTLSFRCPVVLWTEVTLALGDSLGWKMEVALELGIQLGDETLWVLWPQGLVPAEVLSPCDPHSRETLGVISHSWHDTWWP